MEINTESIEELLQSFVIINKNHIHEDAIPYIVDYVHNLQDKLKQTEEKLENLKDSLIPEVEYEEINEEMNDSWLEDITDSVDAALFSGDRFLSDEYDTKRFIWLLKRWNKKIKETCEIQKELKENNIEN